MIFIDRLLSLFSELQARTHVHGPAVGHVWRAARSRVSFEPVEAQMVQEMDEFDRKRSDLITSRDIADARGALLGGMPTKHVRSMYGQDVLDQAQASLQSSH